MRTGTEWVVCGYFLLILLHGCKTPEARDTQPLNPPAANTTVEEQEVVAPVPAKKQPRKHLRITCPAEWMARDGLPLYTLAEHDKFLNDLPDLDGKTVLLEFYGALETYRFANGQYSVEQCHWGGCVPPDQHAPLLEPSGSLPTNVSIKFANLKRYVSNDLNRCERAVYGTGKRYWCMAVKVELTKENNRLTVILHPQ